MAENITNTETELNEQQEQNGAGAHKTPPIRAACERWAGASRKSRCI